MKKGWHELGDRWGILLVQLSPHFTCNYDRLAHFLDLLPDWMPATVEFRHPGWHEESIFTLLKSHRVGYCIMSGTGLPYLLRTTAPFVYVQLHGPEGHTLYGGSYSDDALRG